MQGHKAQNIQSQKGEGGAAAVNKDQGGTHRLVFAQNAQNWKGN
jgi:hypothetical protein